jgi:hypothetical protein
VSTQNSRKKFLAQLLGVFAGLGLVPKLFARRPALSSDIIPTKLPFTVRAESRAIARGGDLA